MMKITQLLDRPIAYHRVFVTLTRNVKAAIMLSQACYWQERAKQADGWWYKTAEEWEEETGLSEHEQRTARKDCEKYLLSQRKGIPAQLFWKVDEDALKADLIGENVQTRIAESANQETRFGTNINKNTENTTENIQDIISSANRTVDYILDSTLSPKAIQDAVRDNFRLTPRWEGKYERQWMQWAIDEAKVTPEQIKRAAEVWRTDRRFNWAVPTLKGIHEHWLELTTSQDNKEQDKGHWL